MLERTIDKLLLASRWILAPIYLGMSLALFALAIKFFPAAYHLPPPIFAIADAEMVLTVSAMIDRVLVASLVVMMMFAGYKNVVSRIDIGDEDQRLSWLDRVAFSSHREH